MTGRRAGRDGQAGFSLIELLAVISILGVIGFGVTEALIVGLKTTDATTSDIAGAVNVQALKSYFTGDAQSAKLVSKKDPAPTCTSSTEVFLHLSWTELDKRARDVSYSFEDLSPPVPGERELVRWSCTAGVMGSKSVLGHFSFNPLGPLPVLALCDGADCPPMEAPGGPATITMKIATNRPQEVVDSIDLTVRRRST